MASEIKVDTISEKTSAGGVTIDGLLIKDGNISGDVALAGTTPTFTIGDAGAEDAALVFDGNAQDFYIALDDSADDLVIGLGSTVGTTPAISINSDRDVTISDGAIDFDVASHDTSNGLKLGGTLVTATAAELNIMDGVTSTAAEINLIDGGTARGTTALADGDGILINDGGTMRMTNVTTVKTYMTGKIGQVVNATHSSEVSSTSATFADSGLTVDITPTATSSKVLVTACIAESRKKDHASALLQSKLLRDSTDLIVITNEAGYTGTTAHNNFAGTSATYLDSPSSTSALTYKVQFANGGGSNGSVTINNSTSVSSITVMEVLA